MKYFLLIILCLFNFDFPSAKGKNYISNEVEKELQLLPASTKVGIIIYDPLKGDTIFQRNITKPMIPASNTKLFTTAVAFTLLGGNFRLSTKILTDDQIIEDGTINGNLYIKGYGNSLFTKDDLIVMVSKIQQLGIRKITGQIIGDDTYFDDIYSRDDWIDDERSSVRLPPVSALVIDKNRTATVKKRGRSYRRYIIDIQNPPLFAAELLKEELIKAGIYAAGNFSKGATPLNARELASSSVTLAEITQMINKNSDNFLAECLYKTIGAESSGRQGNSFYATQAVLNFIDDNGIYSKGTAVVDGSGISRFNQVTVLALTGLLERMYFDITNFDEYYNSLSIAGLDGTLSSRLRFTSAENNLHGKTGTLNGVSALTGYVTTGKGEDLIVSMIFEFKNGGAQLHRDIQDRIIEILAGSGK